MVLIGVISLPFILFLIVSYLMKRYGHGFPKAILSADAKGRKIVSRQSFFIIKREREFLKPDMEALLPLPEGMDFYYSSILPDSFLPQSEDAQDFLQKAMNNGIEVAAGTHFILKDGYQHRTVNESQFIYWLEPEGIELDSCFFYPRSGLGFTESEMCEFPNNELFESTPLKDK